MPDNAFSGAGNVDRLGNPIVDREGQVVGWMEFVGEHEVTWWRMKSPWPFTVDQFNARINLQPKVTP